MNENKDRTKQAGDNQVSPESGANGSSFEENSNSSVSGDFSQEAEKIKHRFNIAMIDIPAKTNEEVRALFEELAVGIVRHLMRYPEVRRTMRQLSREIVAKIAENHIEAILGGEITNEDEAA